MSDQIIDGLSQHAYSHGMDPIDWATELTEGLIQVYRQVSIARAEDETAFPGYCIELSDIATARRIVGALLDAGWTPPTVEKAAGK